MRGKGITILTFVAVLFFTATNNYAQIMVEDASDVWDSQLVAPDQFTDILPRIVVEEASSIYDNQLVFPQQLNDLAANVAPRIVIEYASSLFDGILIFPADLNAEAAAVKDRIIAEYATLIYNLNLVFPAEIIAAASTAAPRVVVEYATDIFTSDMAPYRITDSDADGLPDYWEDANGLDPNDPHDTTLDYDHDGLTNYEEFLRSTDPHLADTDGDKMPDGWEVSHDLDPKAKDDHLDADGDGLTNGQEYERRTDPNNPDTDGDGVSDGDEVTAGTNPLAFSSSLTADTSEFFVSIGAHRTIKLFLHNSSKRTDTFDLSVTGIDANWFSLDQTSVVLSAGERREINLDILITDCGINELDYTIHVSAESPNTGLVANGGVDILLHLSKEPLIVDLVPSDGDVLATNSVQISWRTDVDSTTEVYFRPAGAGQWSAATEDPGTVHGLLLPDLTWDRVYEWYAVSTGVCPAYPSQTATRTFYVHDGVVFQQKEFNFQIDHDYDQRRQLEIVNRNTIPHDVSVEIVNPYEDLVVGFVGSGSTDEKLTVQPGDTANLTIAVHAQDAKNSQYVVILKLICDSESDNPIVDYARVVLDVDVPDFNLLFEEIERNHATLTNKYSITNEGDTLTDLRVYAAEGIAPQISFQPSVEHVYLASGQSIVFSATFHPDGSASLDDAQLIAEAAGQTTAFGAQFGCDSGQSLYTVVMNDIHVCRTSRGWYCTNKPNIRVGFSVPKGIEAERITRARIYGNFNLTWPRNTYRPHDVTFIFNGQEVDKMSDVIPEGPYALDIPPSLVNTGLDSNGQNHLVLKTEHMNRAHYVVHTDFQLILDVESVDFGQVCAANQQEAEALAGDLPFVCSGEPSWLPCPQVDAVAAITEDGIMRGNFDPGENLRLRVLSSNPDIDPHNISVNLTIDDDPDAVGVLFEDSAAEALVSRGGTGTYFDWTLPADNLVDTYHVQAAVTGNNQCASASVSTTIAVNQPVIGQVFDNETGEGLEGATVCAFGFGEDALYVDCADTDADGNYTLSLPEGKYAFFATKDGFTLDSWTGFSTAGGPALTLSHNSTDYGEAPDSGHAQDPVTTAIGNFTLDAADLAFKGRRLNFSFSRFYNSLDTYQGPLGFGWTHSYNIHLSTDGDVTVVKYGDGREEFYVRQPNGSYTAQPGVFATLVQETDGSFTLTDKHRRVYRFDSAGQLTAIEDKNANTITLSYQSGNLTTVTDPVGRQVQLRYDAQNRITQLEDPLGRIITYGYDANGDLVAATDALGNTTAYSYDTNHQLVTATDPKGNVFVTNTYNEQKRVVTAQSDALGNISRFEYDEREHVTTIIDALGSRTVHFHDNRNRLTKIVDPLRYEMSFEYDEDDNRTRAVDKRGGVTQMAYDGRGNLLQTTDALGNTTTFTYDADNNLLSKTDAMGSTARFEYDTNGNLVQTTDALGHVTTIAYNAHGQPLQLTNALGNTTTQTFDGEGNRLTQTDALGNTTAYSYDAVGRMLSQTDPLGRVASYSYDAKDRLIAVTDPAPLGTTLQYTYDANGNRISATDRRGYTTAFAYDQKDRLQSTTDPIGNVVTYAYDALDRRISMTDPLGRITAYGYDANGSLTEVIDATGSVYASVYDAAGNRIQQIDPTGSSVTQTYDLLNRVIHAEDALGNVTSYNYDALGRLIAKTDANGHATSYEYDALGRLVRVIEPTGGITEYAYDALGNKVRFTNALGNDFTYSYDALSRLITDADGYSYQYDAAGNLTRRVDAKGQAADYSYDNRNRLVLITYPDASTVQFGYDANDNLKTMVDALGTTANTYDALNRLTERTDPFGKVVGFGYDAAGNRTSLTYPDAAAVNYSYDALNRLTSVTDWASRTTYYSYDDAGRLLERIYPNGSTAMHSYDAAGRLLSLYNRKADTTVINSYDYSLDPVGNRMQVDRIEPLVPFVKTQSIDYLYDADNRLVSMTGGTFAYDANGSLTEKSVDGKTTTYQWNYENRLQQRSDGSSSASYAYDGLKNRLVKAKDGSEVRYVLDTGTALANVLAETDATGNITARYIYGLGLIAREDATGVKYYHYDPLGSTIALSDEAGDITDRYAYNPFGSLANRGGYSENPFTFVGQYGLIDEGDGHYYVRARYYDSELGRFLNKDQISGPLEDPAGLHRYIYSENNPSLLIDYSGLCPEKSIPDLTLLGYNFIENYLSYKLGSVGAGQLLYGSGAKTLGGFFLAKAAIISSGAIIIVWAFEVEFEREKLTTFGPLFIRGNSNKSPEAQLLEMSESSDKIESDLLLVKDQSQLTLLGTEEYFQETYLKSPEYTQVTPTIDDIINQNNINDSNIMILGNEGAGFIINGKFYENLSSF